MPPDRSPPTTAGGASDTSDAPGASLDALDPARLAEEVRRFVEANRLEPPRRDVLLFVGSSSIRMWPTRESFAGWPTLNRGIDGAHISDVNHYFDRLVAPHRALVIVFCAGDNDIADGNTPERVGDDFAAFVQLVRAVRPATPIVFLSIKASPDRWAHWPRMQRANALARAWADEDARRDAGQRPRLVYLDVASGLLGPDGKPRPELYVDDKLHLSAGAYEIWTRTLTPVLERLMKRCAIRGAR